MHEVLINSKHPRRSVHSTTKLKSLHLKRLSLEMPMAAVKRKSIKIQDTIHNSRKTKFLTRTKGYISNHGLELCSEGVGGTYFVQRDGKSKYFAVFKPVDEEPGAAHNPKNILQYPLLPPGGGAIREVAAYLLDRNFASVPETHLIDGITDPRLSYPSGQVFPKTGSIQRYKENIGDASMMGYTRFLVEEVHRIGILDIRLFNLDRSSENLLVQKKSNGQFHLIPIDHSYILPDTLSNAWFDWLYWPQSKVHFSKEVLAYIARLNIEEDVKILQQLGFAEQIMVNLEITTLFLKAAVVNGWNLYEIGRFVSAAKSPGTKGGCGSGPGPVQMINKGSGMPITAGSSSVVPTGSGVPVSPGNCSAGSLEKLVQEARTVEGKFQMDEYKKSLERFFSAAKNSS
jgi:hypothetical protein